MKSRVLVPLTLVLQAKVAVCLADAVVVLSTADFEHLTTARRCKSSTFMVPNGVSDEFLITSVASAPPPFRVVFVGSWIDRKGVHELLDAWRALHAVLATELLLVGTGAALDPVLWSLGAGERLAVHVEPSITPVRLHEVLATAHVFVLAGWFEGMPLSALEAMASGVPVVLGDVCGNRDLLSPGDPEACGGVLVAPNDVTEIYDALRALAADEPRRRRLGAAARECARQFTWTETARGLDGAYRFARSRVAASKIEPFPYRVGHDPPRSPDSGATARELR